MIAFGWYGGKYVHLDFILPHLPADAEHFCDVYGGSAAVLINRVPAKVETYNDLDTELVNFFAVLRDQPDDLIRSIKLTPFSREELVKACGSSENLSSLERVRRFYVRVRQTRTGLAQTSIEGRWAQCVLTSRAQAWRARFPVGWVRLRDCRKSRKDCSERRSRTRPL